MAFLPLSRLKHTILRVPSVSPMNPHDPLKVLLRYVRDHGDGNVPRRYVTDSGYEGVRLTV